MSWKTVMVVSGGVVCGILVFFWWYLFRMPGDVHRGDLPPLNDEQEATAERLRASVEGLAGEFPERHARRPEVYRGAADWLEERLEGFGYTVEHQPVSSPEGTFANLIAERQGANESGDAAVVVVGAHYDSVPGTPGADDNASGVAGVLELARRFADRRPDRTVRFVMFANEEAPYFHTDSMGSLQYARRLDDRGEDVACMLSLEMLGYYDDTSGAQEYPPVVGWFYPDRGDFIAFVSNVGNRSIVARATGAFRGAAEFPAWGLAGPSFVTGVGLSDHWSFWQVGSPAVMVTDTAFFRNPHYHRVSDRPETLDYDRFARVVDGVEAVVAECAAQ